MVNKMWKNSLRWLGHILRRFTDAVKLVNKIYVGKNKRRGRPKKKIGMEWWSDLRMMEVSEEDIESNGCLGLGWPIRNKREKRRRRRRRYQHTG